MRVYDGDEDPDDDPDAFDMDDSGLFCPKCGCQHALKVLTWPVPGSWMRGEGQALCTECDIKFPIQMELEQEQRNPYEFDIYERDIKRPSWYGRQRR